MAVSSFKPAPLQPPTPNTPPQKPLALVVLLENVGHIAGLNLPQWSMNVIDFVTEEYAKVRLWQLGAYRIYDRVVILEDEKANGEEMAHALLSLSRTHRIDQLLLVHGQERSLVGYRGKAHIGDAVFAPLLAAYAADPAVLDLRMVYGVNCFGASLAPVWLQLGATAVNGAIGVNWLPEPSLSLFLKRWLGGAPFSDAVIYSHTWALKIGKRLWPDRANGEEDPHIVGSRQLIYGQQDLSIYS